MKLVGILKVAGEAVFAAAIIASTAHSFSSCNKMDGKGKHEAVDLGLSVKWAACNIGAANPEDYGSYFSWGETKTKSTYTWKTYKYCQGAENTMTKYCTDSKYGTVDDRRALEPADDAAHANWGGDWRMPTAAEFDELSKNCTCTWDSQKQGYTVTSNVNGNSIFLPAAGFRYDNSVSTAGTYGYYATSTLDAYDNNESYWLMFNAKGFSTSRHSRYYGPAIRPVTK